MTHRRRPSDITPLPADGWGRSRLPYPYFYDGWLIQDYEYDTAPGTGESNGVCDVYTVPLTPDERLKFSSALLLGAMIVYPTEWMKIWDIWENALNLVNTYETVGCNVPDGNFCDRVLECIEEQEPGNTVDKDKFADIEAAEKDAVCGSIEFAVEEIMQQGEVVLDVIEAALNIAGSLASLIQTFGRFGAIPTAVEGAVSGLFGAVAAARSQWQAQTTEDAIRCGIYCAVVNAGGPPYALTEATLREGYEIAKDDLGTITLAELTLEATWHFIPKRLIASRFQVGVQLGLTSALCSTLCEPCQELWVIEWLGRDISGLDIQDGVQANNVINAEYVQGADGDYAVRAIITYDPGTTFTFLGASVNGNLQKGRWSGGTNNMLSVDVTGYQNRWLEQQNVGFGQPGLFAYDDPSLTSQSTSTATWTIRASRSPSPYTTQRGAGFISSLKLWGSGTPPSDLKGGTLTML